ncbi:hypothetical protein CDAR_590511 [Caerostris darwini]|uniref:Uncharacterized protein n=1 Tax=Caerostris darwini TaxID=1538125 RepID=A0AAV4TRT9_9ARAC|nr:hypothetical protein CDAR_590511 [Caerostris darwini]
MLASQKLEQVTVATDVHYEFIKRLRRLSLQGGEILPDPHDFGILSTNMRLLALLSTYFGRGKPISDGTATPTTHPGLFLGRDEIYNDVSAKEGGGEGLLSAHFLPLPH